jgi:hypothetical protein
MSSADSIPCRNSTAVPETLRGLDGWLSADLRKVPIPEMRADYRHVRALAVRCGVLVSMFEADGPEGRVFFRAIVSRHQPHYEEFRAGWFELFGAEPWSFA